jgi:hypothetical protein
MVLRQEEAASGACPSIACTWFFVSGSSDARNKKGLNPLPSIHLISGRIGNLGTRPMPHMVFGWIRMTKIVQKNEKYHILKIIIYGVEDW